MKVVRVFLLWGLFVVFTFANVVDIAKVDSAISIFPQYQTNYIDKEKKYNPKDILYEKDTVETQKNHIGYDEYIYWSKVQINNSGDKDKLVMIKNLKPGTDHITVYVYDSENELQKIHYLGDMEDVKSREIVSNDNVFAIRLYPHEQYTLVTRYDSLGPILLSWQILSLNEYQIRNNLQFIFYSFFLGVLVALIIYNFSIFLVLQDKTYLMYILNAMTITWLNYAINGMIYYLDIGIDLYFLTLSTWLVTPLINITFSLFTSYYFDLKNVDKKGYYFLKGLIWFNTFLLLLSGIMYFYNELIVYTPYITYGSILSVFVIYLFTIYGTFKRYYGVWYFFVAESVYLIAIILFGLYVEGDLDPINSYQFLIIPTAIIIEMIIISFALSKRVEKIKKSDELKENILKEQSKFVNVGKNIRNLSHQCIGPLNSMSSSVAYMEALYKHDKKEKLLEVFHDKTVEINNVIEYMKGTINDLYDFYSNNEKEEFNLKKQIDFCLMINKDKFLVSNISVENNITEEYMLYGSKYSFSNVIMTLLENSIDIFSQREIKERKIVLDIKETSDRYELFYKDTAGGITHKNIDDIFTLGVSKKQKSSIGLGLYLAKKIIKSCFDGDIKIDNSKEGVLFIISLKKNI